MIRTEPLTPLEEILKEQKLVFSLEKNSSKTMLMWSYYSGDYNWPQMEKTPWYLRVDVWGISSCVLGGVAAEAGYPGLIPFGFALTAVMYFRNKSRNIFLRYMWLRVQVAENMKLKKKVKKEIEAGDPNPNHW